MEQQNSPSGIEHVDMTVSSSGSEIDRADLADSDAGGSDAGIPDIKLYIVEHFDVESSDVEGSEGEAFGSDDFEAGISGIECYHVEDSDGKDSTTRLPTFKLFPKLPIEIRRMIWRASFRGPQRHVWSNIDGACCERIGLLRPPPALSVNKESRREALNCYEKLEEGEQRCECYRGQTSCIFFNKETDILRTETTMSVNGRLGTFCEDHFKKSRQDILGQV